MIPRVLVLAGIDPSGGAGLSVDARVLERGGAMTLPVVTCTTAQDRRSFRGVFPVPVDQVLAALEAAAGDGPLHAIKLGMLGSTALAEALSEPLRALAGRAPVVVDPVLGATAGGYEPDPALRAAYREQLLPLATVLTPNLPEARALFGTDAPDAVHAAARAAGAAVLLKAGHADGAELTDRLLLPDGDAVEYAHPKLSTGPVRGTGCALASALAARLAQGSALPAACEGAIRWLQGCLRALGPAADDGLPRPLGLMA